MKKIHLYSYCVNENDFKHDDSLLERTTVNFESKNEKELTFAVKLHPKTHTRTPIAPKSEDVYYDEDTKTYRVWFYEPDVDKAIEVIGNYILDRVESMVGQHKRHIAQLEDEGRKATEFLKKNRPTFRVYK